MPPASRVGDLALVPADGHGCPACPHVCVGPGIQGSCDVLVNGQPVLRLGDPGIHAACCGPNKWNTAQGSPTVLVNSLNVIRQNDPTTHCGGSGKMIMGSPNVIVGDSYGGSYKPHMGMEIAKELLQMLMKQMKPSLPKPNLPGKPSKPHLPSKPPKPHLPHPEKPSFPHGEKPDLPRPDLPDKPEKPSFPHGEKPDKPSIPKPDLPDKPEKPTIPVGEKPDKPSIPKPDLPDKPEKPTIPVGEKPEKPELPQPNIPDKPEVPQPDIPDKPEAPDVPTPTTGEKPTVPDAPEPPPGKPGGKSSAWETEHSFFAEAKSSPLSGLKESGGLELSRKKTLKDVEFKKLGGSDNYLKLGMAEGKMSQGYKFDPVKAEHEVTPLSLKGKIAAFDGQLKGQGLSGLVSGKARLEAFSAEGEFTPLQVIGGKEGLTARASLGAEGNLIKGSAEGKLALTPKTIYDNTLGPAVGFVEGFFREPQLSKMPQSWDHGLVMGGKVEAGLGAAAKAHAGLKAGAGEVIASAELKVGAGPMAGLKLFFGVK